MLQPEDIRAREFPIRSEGGYDLDEVDQFRADVAEVVAKLLADAESAPVTDAWSGSFTDIGSAAQRILNAADESAKDILDEARAEAARLRDEARADREQAARELEELERRQQEHAATQRRAHEAIQSAGQATRQLLSDATQPREQLAATLQEARRLLLGRFDEAEQAAESAGRRADEIVHELEVDLPLWPEATADDRPDSPPDETRGGEPPQDEAGEGQPPASAQSPGDQRSPGATGNGADPARSGSDRT